MPHTLAVLSVLSLLVLCTASANERQWQRGTLLGIYEARVDARSLKSSPGTIKAPSPKYLVNYTYAFDGGQHIYQSVETRKSKNQPPPFTVNNPVQFAIEDQHVYLKDDRGREHDTTLVLRRSKNQSGASTSDRGL